MTSLVFITSQGGQLPGDETGKQGPVEMKYLSWEEKQDFQPVGAGPHLSGIKPPCHTRPDRGV